MSPEPTARSAPEQGRELSVPWEESAERAVLGAVLLDPAALDSALELLVAGDFYRPAHRLIFEGFCALAARSESIDPVTLRAELQRNGSLDKIGGAAFLASLIDGLPRTANVSAYARIVHDRSLLRQVLDVGDYLQQEASGSARSAIEVVDDAQARLFRLSEAGRREGFRPIAEVAEAGLQAIEELAERREMVTGLSTGIPRLDMMTSGLQPADLIILAARPSMGKTALALNIAAHAALRRDVSVGFFSLEMSAQQLFFRMLSGEGTIDSHKLRTGRLSGDEWTRLTDAYDVLASSRIYIDDTPAATPMEIRSKARRLRAEHNLGLLVVDYLQLMQVNRRVDSRQQEISEISRSLKAIAKELSVPVLALSQLSRAPDQRAGDHRPQLSDLRESGAIEQDADVVMFIFRPEMYEKDEDKRAELQGKAQVIVAKQRNGPTGLIPLYFVQEYTRFYEEAGSQDDALGRGG
jgi:replicative DNA helicase